jgi:hypothetical protein
MIFATVEVMPLIIVLSKLAEEVATFVLMIVEVDTTPFTVEVKALVSDDKELEVEATASVTEVVAKTPLILEVNSPVEVA